MATKARLWPDTPTHPGVLLADELEARQIPIAAVRLALDPSEAELEALLSGQRNVSANVAWGLERLFGDISARFWMGLQTDYDFAVERLRQATG